MLSLRTSTAVGILGAIVAATTATGAAADHNGVLSVAGVTVEGLALWRGDLDGGPLTSDDDPNSSIPGGGGPFGRFDSDELDADVGGGARITVDAYVFGNFVRYSAFGAGGFGDDVTKTGLDRGALNTDAAYEVNGADIDLSNSDVIFALKADYESSIAGTDSSMYLGGRPQRTGWSFLYGTRSFYMQDKLKTTAFDDEDDFLGNDNDIDRAKLEIDNTMLGGQIGLEGATQVGPGLLIGGFVKGGLLANFVDVKSSLGSADDLTNGIGKSFDSTEFAQFVEVSGRLSYEFSPSIALTASAMLLYINGIEEVGGQFANIADRQARGIDADDDAIYYGGTLGLTFKLN